MMGELWWWKIVRGRMLVVMMFGGDGIVCDDLMLPMPMLVMKKRIVREMIAGRVQRRIWMLESVVMVKRVMTTVVSVVVIFVVARLSQT